MGEIPRGKTSLFKEWGLELPYEYGSRSRSRSEIVCSKETHIVLLLQIADKQYV
jgi:hypothetical protein